MPGTYLIPPGDPGFWLCGFEILTCHLFSGCQHHLEVCYCSLHHDYTMANTATDLGRTESEVGKPQPSYSEHAAYTPNMELIEAAVTASDAEALLPKKELFSRYWPAVTFSMLLSAALIMEGMDTGLINNFFAQPAYKEKFGWVNPADGKKYISADWQAGIGAGNNCGSIIGLLLNGYLQSKFGSRRVYMVSPRLLVIHLKQSPFC